MALIKCSECGKEVSDKATACPGCGCPVKQPADYSRFDKDELWQKAYDIQYKQSKENLPEAIDIYRHIINSYSGSAEAGYARKQLQIIGADSPPVQPVQASTDTAPIDNKKPAVSIYNYQDNAVRATPSTRTYAPNVSTPAIPSGLYWATAILGFPLGTGIALGCYFGANSRINKGDFAKAEKYIKSTKIACWIIIVPCAIAALFLLSMCSMIFR